MAVNKREFFAWLEMTEGPRKIVSYAPGISGDKWVIFCKVQATSIGHPVRQLQQARFWLIQERAVAKYRRWLTEFEQTQGERDVEKR